MKALSIRQPFATLIVAGIKDIENRSWSTKYRGPLLIHAAKKFDSGGREILYKMGLEGSCLLKGMEEYSGGVIGEVELIDCVTESSSSWFEGKYGFILKNPKMLPFKSCKGRLGIFTLDIL